MQLRILFFLAFSLAFATLHAQSSFERTFGGPSLDGAYSVVQAEDSGYVVCGYWNSMNFTGQDQLVVLKTDQDGNTLWTRFYSTNFDYPEHSKGYHIIPLAEGGFVAVGSAFIYNPSLNPQIYLLKLNSNGDTLWTRTFGSQYSEFENYFVRQTSDGGFVVTGKMPFGWGGGNPVVAKTDANGDSLWLMTYQPNLLIGSGAAHSVVELSSGYLVMGYRPQSGSELVNDVSFLRLDASGDTMWSRTIPGWNDDLGYSMQETDDHHLIVCGATQSAGAGGYDALLMKADTNGTLLWSRTFGGLDNEFANSISLTSDGGFIIAGSTQSTGAGGYDAWLIKTDAQGVEEWSGTYGSFLDEYAYSVKQTFDGGYIATGKRGNDIYLFKTDANGNLTSTTAIDPAANAEPFRIYPNPFSEETLIETRESFDHATLSLYNANGEEVKRLSDLSGKKIVLSRDQLPVGLYFLRLTQDAQTIAEAPVIVGE